MTSHQMELAGIKLKFVMTFVFLGVLKRHLTVGHMSFDMRRKALAHKDLQLTACPCNLVDDQIELTPELCN